MIEEAIKIANDDRSISISTIVLLESEYAKGHTVTYITNLVRDRLHKVLTKTGYVNNIKLLYTLSNSDTAEVWVSNLNKAINKIESMKTRKVTENETY